MKSICYNLLVSTLKIKHDFSHRCCLQSIYKWQITNKQLRNTGLHQISLLQISDKYTQHQAISLLLFTSYTQAFRVKLPFINFLFYFYFLNKILKSIKTSCSFLANSWFFVFGNSNRYRHVKGIQSCAVRNIALKIVNVLLSSGEKFYWTLC